MSDAVSALISWCNDQGGINGRKVVGTDYDAALMQANSVMQEACGSQFMMVGHGFAMDQTVGADPCGLQLGCGSRIHGVAGCRQRTDDLSGCPIPRRLRQRVGMVPDGRNAPRSLNDFDIVEQHNADDHYLVHQGALDG